MRVGDDEEIDVERSLLISVSEREVANGRFR